MKIIGIIALALTIAPLIAISAEKKIKTQQTTLSTKPEPTITQAKTLFPLEIKGVNVGVPFSDAEKIYPGFSKHCSGQRKNGVTFCTLIIPDAGKKEGTLARLANEYPSLHTFGGERIKLFSIIKIDETIQTVRIKAATSAWLTIKYALTERYGEPYSSKESVIQNRAGSNFDQEEVLWRDGEKYITATKRSGEIDEMSISLHSDSQDKKLSEIYATEAKEGAKDL